MAGWTLPEGPRQVVAAILASLGFLALFLAGGLAWWLSLVLGVAIYAALLLVIRRRHSAAEILVADRVTAAQLDEALGALDKVVARLRKAADAAPETVQPVIDSMAARVASIRAQVASDPQDYEKTRRFISFFLPAIVGAVESYVGLAADATGSQSGRLDALADRIRGFLPVIERIDDACRENNFTALEVEVAVLDEQLTKFRGTTR